MMMQCNKLKNGWMNYVQKVQEMQRKKPQGAAPKRYKMNFSAIIYSSSRVASLLQGDPTLVPETASLVSACLRLAPNR
ncbi:MAG: hypothetical protein JWQ40_2 [Segetibacter sp.]|nr:hypothetical protein [Segetibacter sp.]